MNTTLLPYQKRWIQDNSQIKLMEKSRQIGISWATAYSLVRKQISSTKKADAWVASRDVVQAKLFLEDCKHFASALNNMALSRNLPQTLPLHLNPSLGLPGSTADLS